MSLRSPEAFFVLLGLVLTQRCADLLLSRRNLSRRRGPASSADSRSNWRAMVLLHAALIVLPGVEVELRGEVGGPLAWSLGWTTFVLAQALRLWAIVTLGDAWNARGRVPDDLRPVSHGPYRWMRHPNYLAVALEFLAVPAAGGAWVSLVLLNVPHALVLRRRVRGEEALLRALPGYAEAMEGRGGLLPRFGTRKPSRP